jgi:hypothetical protein
MTPRDLKPGAQNAAPEAEAAEARLQAAYDRMMAYDPGEIFRPPDKPAQAMPRRRLSEAAARIRQLPGTAKEHVGESVAYVGEHKAAFIGAGAGLIAVLTIGRKIWRRFRGTS